MMVRRAVWPWFAGSAVLIALDQFTKILIRQNFDLHESLSVWGSTVRLTYVLNPGIAFGLPVTKPLWLLVFGWIAAMVLAVYLFVLVRRHDPLRWPVMLFLAGAIGNSIDRAFYGQVTDFMDVDFPDFIMDRWPVFNVADSCVTIGIILMLILLFFHRAKVAEPPYSYTPVAQATDPFRSTTGPDSVPDHERSGPAASTD